MLRIAHRIGNGMLDALTWIIAIIGLTCVLSLLAAAFFGISIMLFASGSMAPTIPENSATLAVATKASSIQIGDVVSVDREEGQLPITHRVIAIDSVPGNDAARSISMKGDANDSADIAPYEVTDVRRVVFVMPGLAPWVQALADLRVLGTIATISAMLIVRAFIRPHPPEHHAVTQPAIRTQSRISDRARRRPGRRRQSPQPRLRYPNPRS